MTEDILIFILKEASTINFGVITITFQDKRTMQIEKNEKFRIDKHGIVDGRSSLKNTKFTAAIVDKLRQLLQNVAYGQVVISVKDGRPFQVEKLEKHRLSDFVGIGGDAI